MSELKENKKESTTSKKQRQSTSENTGKRFTLISMTGEETDEDLDEIAQDLLDFIEGKK